MRGLAGRLSADRPPRALQQLRGVHSHRRLDVQPAREMAEGHARIAMAAQDRLAELSARLACLAAGSQRLHPSGPRLPRSRHQQEGRHGAGLSAAGRQLPAVGVRPLPAQPSLRQCGGRGKARAAAMADHGAGGHPLHAGHRNLAMGEQRSGRRTGRGDGLLRRHADAGDSGGRLDPARASAGLENPGRQCRRSDAAAARANIRTA